MGILRTDRVAGLGGANAIKGSTFLGTFGSATYGNQIEIQKDSELDIGDGNLTVECWFNSPQISGYQSILGQEFYNNFTSNKVSFNFYLNNDGIYLWNRESGSAEQKFGVTGLWVASTWNHVAWVREGTGSNENKIYLNGSLVGSAFTNNVTYSSEQKYHIGGNFYSQTAFGQYPFSGHISNLRMSNIARYTANFTPPTSEFVVDSNTILLTCQSPSNILKEETGKTLSHNTLENNTPAQASRFTPNSPVGFSTTTDVGSQYGSTFDGFGNFATSTYMVPPGGNTRERNRGRGLIGQGNNTTSPYNVKAISYIEIQSGGTAFDFGDSTNGSMYAMTAVSSSTRAVFAGGHTSQASPYPVTNLMEFVTIATTSNCTDFGDLDVGAAHRNGASNQTRGLIAAGYSPNTRQIDKIEIATLGNATDYGDLTDQGFYGLNQGGMVSSTTRGLYAGGSGNSAPVAVNTITFSLFSTSGNSTNFGDLTHTNAYFNVGNSNGVRGVFMGGADIDSPYAVTDQIDFVTIATAGNASDFGSLNTARYNHMGTSNSTRGVIAGGRISPAPTLPVTNHMEFITITSTGNGSDFGELIEPERAGAGCSDSHGGLE